MDHKRHFKRHGKHKALPKYFQVETVIEPASEFISSMLTKNDRKTILVDELLSDTKLKNYSITYSSKQLIVSCTINNAYDIVVVLQALARRRCFDALWHTLPRRQAINKSFRKRQCK